MELTETQDLKVRHLFTVYDTRNDGVLRREDYELLGHRVATERGFEPGSDEHERLTRYFLTTWERTKAIADFSRDGQIALDEWVDFYEIVICDPRAFEAVVGSLVDMMFDLFDFDENASLDREELASFRRAFGVEEADDGFFDELDIDGSGALSTAELRTAIADFFCSEDPAAPGNHFFGRIEAFA